MLYWRGIVLDYFDGTFVESLNKERELRSNFKLQGKKVYQTIYLEPYGNIYFFALDKPVSLNYRDSQFFDDLTVRSRQGIERRTKYIAVSVLSGVEGRESIDTRKYLQLPPGDFGKIVKLVRK